MKPFGGGAFHCSNTRLRLFYIKLSLFIELCGISLELILADAVCLMVMVPGSKNRNKVQVRSRRSWGEEAFKQRRMVRKEFSRRWHLNKKPEEVKKQTMGLSGGKSIFWHERWRGGKSSTIPIEPCVTLLETSLHRAQHSWIILALRDCLSVPGTTAKIVRGWGRGSWEGFNVIFTVENNNQEF